MTLPSVHHNDANEGLGFYRKLGELLRSAREATGLTQREVAKHFGHRSHTWTRDHEKGQSRLTVLDLVRFCKLYRLDVCEVLRAAERATEVEVSCE